MKNGKSLRLNQNKNSPCRTRAAGAVEKRIVNTLLKRSGDFPGLAEFGLEPISSGVEASLDGSDGAVENIAHLSERPSLEVEGDKGSTIHLTELFEAVPDLMSGFGLHQIAERTGDAFLFDGGELSGIEGGFGLPAEDVIDRHSDGDLLQPGGKAFGLAQLIELPPGTNEDFLTDLQSLGVVSNPSEDNGVDQSLEAFGQSVEGFSFPGLSTQDVPGTTFGLLTIFDQSLHDIYLFSSPPAVEGSDIFRWEETGSVRFSKWGKRSEPPG